MDRWTSGQVDKWTGGQVIGGPSAGVRAWTDCAFFGGNYVQRVKGWFGFGVATVGLKADTLDRFRRG